MVGRQARKLVQAIADGDIAYLGRYGADEYYLLGYFGSGDVVFLDLETTGLNGTRPLFLIGTMVQREGGLACQQYLARSFDEEAAAVAAAPGVLKGVSSMRLVSMVAALMLLTCGLGLNTMECPSSSRSCISTC